MKRFASIALLAFVSACDRGPSKPPVPATPVLKLTTAPPPVFVPTPEPGTNVDEWLKEIRVRDGKRRQQASTYPDGLIHSSGDHRQSAPCCDKTSHATCRSTSDGQ